MAVCRFRWDGSDVYVYYDVGGFINCCGCSLSEKSFHANTEWEMIEHLREHQKRGDSVPADAFAELTENANGQSMKTTDEATK